MAPLWLTALAWVSLGSAFASAGWILADIFVRGHRQPMWIMEVVWPVTALYFGPLALLGYRAWGRPAAECGRHEDKPDYAVTAVGVSHCGAGCSIGDVVAEFAVFALGATIAGIPLLAEYAGDYLAAVALGVVFQYFAIAPMRNLPIGKGLLDAAKADVLSLTSFEVGLFGWMALMFFVFFPQPHLTPADPAYWFLMQVGMVAGFFTAWPVNVWLIRRGIKEAM